MILHGTLLEIKLLASIVKLNNRLARS